MAFYCIVLYCIVLYCIVLYCILYKHYMCTSINVITINAHTGTYVCTYSTYVHNVYSMFCVCLHILLFFVVFCVLCTVLPNPPEEVQA